MKYSGAIINRVINGKRTFAKKLFSLAIIENLSANVNQKFGGV
jgi:hypothetical protein